MTDDRDDILAAVAESLGATVQSSTRVRSEASGEGFITGHDVELLLDDGNVEHHTIFIESSPRTPAGEGVLRMRDDSSGDEVAVWLYPRDPRLPALPAAVYAQAAAVILQRLGFDPEGLELSVLSYRPGKRAVVRMTTPRYTVFLKVVRPERAETIRNRHEQWAAAGIPVPVALAWADDGLIALAPLAGREAIGMVDVLSNEGAGFLDSLDDLLARVAVLPSEQPARASLITRLRWYLRRVSALDEALAPDIRALGKRIGQAHERGGTPRLATIHGDLHLAQLFVDPTAPDIITGMLDIDTAGTGDPADDAAALWAHLVVTADFRDRRGDTQYVRSARALAELQRQRWVRADDAGFPHRTAAIAATHLLGHALTGSIATSEAVRLATQVLDEDDESLLIPSSHPSHP